MTSKVARLPMFSLVTRHSSPHSNVRILWNRGLRVSGAGSAPAPEGRVTIAQRFSVGSRNVRGARPGGTVEPDDCFGRPFGTRARWRQNPTLKRWASTRCPSGAKPDGAPHTFNRTPLARVVYRVAPGGKSPGLSHPVSASSAPAFFLRLSHLARRPKREPGARPGTDFLFRLSALARAGQTRYNRADSRTNQWREVHL